MKSSLRLSLYVFVLLILAVLVFSVYTPQTEAGGGTLTKDDYLKWVGRNVDLTWACTYYDLNYAATADVNTLSSAEKSVEWYNKHYVVGDGYWEALTEYTAYEPVYVTKELCHTNNVYDNVTNETIWTEEVCYDTSVQKGTKEVTGQRWEPYSWDRNALHLRFCAKLKPVLGFRSIEHIPIMFGHEFREYDWWTSNYTYRRSVYGTCEHCSTDTVMPLLVSNSTYNDGAYISGSFERFWGNFTVNSAWSLLGYVYYNDETDYALVDPTETYQLEMDVDEGNSTDYGNPHIANTKVVYHFSNTTGTRLEDEMGNYYGSLVNGPATIPDAPIGTGIFCDGDNDYINLSGSSLAGLAQGSIAMWINLSTGDEYVMRVEDDTDHFFSVEIYDTPAIGFRVNAKNVNNPATDMRTDIPHNTWQHIVISWNSTAFYLYQNGSYVNLDIDTMVMPSFSANLFLCGRNAEIHNEMEIDEFRIYDRVLTDEEIMMMYNQTKGLMNTTQVGDEEIEQSATETQGRTAIVQGIQQSVLDDETTYTDQQIYIRYADGTQLNGTFDKVTVEGNQTWAFNYIPPSGNINPKTNMNNLTNTVYVWEQSDLNISQITAQVKGLINSTMV